MKNPLNLVTVVGLTLGGVLGFAGSVVADPNLRSVLWAIDGAGIVVAAALLTLQHFRAGHDCVAAGFLVFAIAEGVMLSGTAATLDASIPSFAAGAALWSAGLLLISLPRQFSMPVRGVGVIAAILLGITSARIFSGAHLSPISKPLPTMAYPFLVLTLAGWIYEVVKGSRRATAQNSLPTAIA